MSDRPQIDPPYLLFLGDARDALAAKTARGVFVFRPEWCLGQLRLPGCKPRLDLPEMTVEEAAALRVRSASSSVSPTRAAWSARHGPPPSWRRSKRVSTWRAAFMCGSATCRRCAMRRRPTAAISSTCATRPRSSRWGPACAGPASACSRWAPTPRSARCTPRSRWKPNGAGAASSAPSARPGRLASSLPAAESRSTRWLPTSSPAPPSG